MANVRKYRITGICGHFLPLLPGAFRLQECIFKHALTRQVEKKPGRRQQLRYPMGAFRDGNGLKTIDHQHGNGGKRKNSTEIGDNFRRFFPCGKEKEGKRAGEYGDEGDS